MRATVVLILVFALLISACAGPAQQPPAVEPTVEDQEAAAQGPTVTAEEQEPVEAVSKPFVFAVRQGPVTMDPHVDDLSYSQYAQNPVYEPLIDYMPTEGGDEVDLGPRLAEAWEVSDDATTYTFTLREGIEFTDGTPFNADAVKWNLQRLTELSLPPSARIPPLKSVEVLDEYTVQITLEAPYAPFLATMTLPKMISPTAAMEHEEEGDYGRAWLDENAVGTGPYMLETWVRGQELTFVKNPDYWRGWEGNHVDKIVLTLAKEPTTQRLLLETGDAHLADNITFDDLDALSQVPGVVVEPGTSPEMLNICIKDAGITEDKLVRQAFSQVFDYEAFIEGVLNGRARQPLGPIPFGVWALDRDLEPYTRDVERAKELMTEAGYPDGGFDVTIQTIAAYGWYQPREAQILQQNLAEIGVEATIDDKADAATFLASIRDKERAPEIYFWRSVAAVDDPDYELRRLYHSEFVGNRGVNGMWFQDERVDELLDEALRLPTREERKPLYDELQAVLKDEAICIWAAQMNYYITRRDSLNGYVWNPFGLGVPDYYSIWISQ
jgi:peptide/nickel transport system substrate-binding protein